MTAKTRLEISRSALSHNFNFLKSKTGEGVAFMAVVKANGYGTDLLKFAQQLEHLGADYLCVAYVSEGVILRQGGIQLPILVLHAQIEDLADAITYRLELALYSIDFTQALINYCQNTSAMVEVHVNINTGLNRLGVRPEELAAFAKLIQSSPVLKLKWGMTHLIGSEDLALKAITLQQLDLFEHAVAELEKTLGITLKKHALNSSGILNYPTACYDMVRSGIALHGYANDPILDNNLKPISTLYTQISAIRKVSPGESVSYNRLFIATEEMTVATIPIGHADGFTRDLGNGKGQVWVGGKWAKVVGMVCMDLFMVDISSINAKVGDPVIILGPQSSASSLAKSSNTISYELLTGIGSRIPRVFVD